MVLDEATAALDPSSQERLLSPNLVPETIFAPQPTLDLMARDAEEGLLG